MEVLLFNLSLKRFLIKLDASQPSSPPAKPARWHCAPPAFDPIRLLDGSSLSSTSLVQLVSRMCSRDSRSMNAAYKTASATPWTQSEYRYHSPRAQVKQKIRVALQGAPLFPGLELALFHHPALSTVKRKQGMAESRISTGIKTQRTERGLWKSDRIQLRVEVP
jgi:hypothetical protein